MRPFFDCWYSSTLLPNNDFGWEIAFEWDPEEEEDFPYDPA